MAKQFHNDNLYTKNVTKKRKNRIDIDMIKFNKKNLAQKTQSQDKK